MEYSAKQELEITKLNELLKKYKSQIDSTFLKYSTK